MLRVIEQSSAAGAKSYFSRSDYYSEGQELAGQWRGKGAERLGLRGEIGKADWDSLCDNKNPATGKTLTVRQKANRRVGYDFNFHVPKSVSVLYGLSGDERILAAFKDSVGETMREMEAEMKTRVRAGKGLKADTDRDTGNMIWGEYVHTTARPVDGTPDPHLHAHCFVFNVTYDNAEHRWKAGQFADLKRDAPYFEAMFHAKFAHRMVELGLPVERTKQGWELGGIPQTVIDRFSRRTAEIEAIAATKGIVDPKAKGELGAKTRQKKVKSLTADELRAVWTNRMRPEEGTAVLALAAQLGQPALPSPNDAAREAVQYAADHVFERRSVVAERDFLREALRRGYGAATPEAIHDEAKRQHFITAERDGRIMLTSREVLAEETAMLAVARKGRGACDPLGRVLEQRPTDPFELNRDQKRAVRHVATSKDRVILIRGAAGTGKTSMMREAVRAIEAGGHTVFTFAPSADASRGTLRDEGFHNAETVATLLESPRMREAVRGQVIWVDEAGLLGTKTMRKLFDLAEQSDARVVLSGDRRQHASVERGAALRLLETDAGLVPAEIREIQRQSGEYKRVVRLLSDGKTAEAFKGLDRMGWIREVPDNLRYRVMANDYLATMVSLPKKERVLVVSPTHHEGDKITAEIRGRMQAAGKLGSDARTFRTLEDAGLTVAQRSDAINIHAGDVLVFHQNAKGHRKGDRVTVGREGLPVETLRQSERFGLFHTGAIQVAAGDVLRICRNGKSTEGKPLNNGELVKVAGFSSKGDIQTTEGKTIPKDYGHFGYGYVVTSFASQGKSVAQVLVGQSSWSFPASSREQFYVSVSRGKKKATIYCDDRAGLLEAVGKSDPRLSATELIRERVQELRRQQTPLHLPHRDLKERDYVR